MDEMGIYPRQQLSWEMFRFTVGAPAVSHTADAELHRSSKVLHERAHAILAFGLDDSRTDTQAAINNATGITPLHSITMSPERAHAILAFDLDDVRMDTSILRFFSYPTGSGTAVLVDGTPDQYPVTTEPDFGYQRVVDELRYGGRELVAEELVEILRNSLEDPEEPEVKLFSLQSMARFLISHREINDPILGPDPGGIMQIEWHIDGNGLLVMAFLEGSKVHVVAQADNTSDRQVLDCSVELPVDQVLEDFGYLVPTH